MDIKNMTRKEIEDYLASMSEDKTEPSKEQENIASKAIRGADGNYDVSKVNLGKMFADKADEHSYTDEQGNKQSYNRGSKWQAYIDKNITDPAAKADMDKQIHDVISANPNMSPKELKYRLRAVEANLRRRYPNSVSRHFDISGALTDTQMAKDLLALDLKSVEKPEQVLQVVHEPEPEQALQAVHEQKSPTTHDELSAAFKRIKNRQASDTDLALFSAYSEEQLRKMGFGPISIAAIKNKKETQEQKSKEPAVKLESESVEGSAEGSPDVANVSANAQTVGKAFSSNGGTYSQGIGKAKTYFVNGEQTDKATYVEAQGREKARKLREKEAQKNKNSSKVN